MRGFKDSLEARRIADEMDERRAAHVMKLRVERVLAEHLGLRSTDALRSLGERLKREMQYCHDMRRGFEPEVVAALSGQIIARPVGSVDIELRQGGAGELLVNFHFFDEGER